MTIVLKFCFPILNFCLKVLANRFFFFEIFFVIFKKSSRFSMKPLFRIWFGIIFYCFLASNIFLVSSIGLKDIYDKEVLRCV